MYEHIQYSRLIWITIILLSIIIIMGISLSIKLEKDNYILLIYTVPYLLILFLTTFLFYGLKIVVSSEKFFLSFGIGLINRKINLNEIKSTIIVNNKWWYGLGIRRTPHGWLWNIGGLKAVEIEYVSGKKFRIGTDQPEKLSSHINDLILKLQT